MLFTTLLLNTTLKQIAKQRRAFYFRLDIAPKSKNPNAAKDFSLFLLSIASMRQFCYEPSRCYSLNSGTSTGVPPLWREISDINPGAVIFKASTTSIGGFLSSRIQRANASIISGAPPS